MSLQAAPPRWSALLVAILLAAACRSKAEPPLAEPWLVARKLLLDEGHPCFRGDLDFCLGEPRDLDPHLQRVLDRERSGQMPVQLSAVRSVVLRARGSYGLAWQDDPTLLARVLEKVRDGYAHPDQVRRLPGDTVELDCKTMPGPFVQLARGRPFIEAPEDLIDQHWRAELVGSRLLAFSKAHPGHKEYVLRIHVPGRGGRIAVHRYRWRPRAQRIVIDRTDNMGVHTWRDDVELDALARGEVPLGLDAVESCHAADIDCRAPFP